MTRTPNPDNIIVIVTRGCTSAILAAINRQMAVRRRCQPERAGHNDDQPYLDRVMPSFCATKTR